MISLQCVDLLSFDFGAIWLQRIQFGTILLHSFDRGFGKVGGVRVILIWGCEAKQNESDLRGWRTYV